MIVASGTAVAALDSPGVRKDNTMNARIVVTAVAAFAAMVVGGYSVVHLPQPRAIAPPVASMGVVQQGQPAAGNSIARAERLADDAILMLDKDGVCCRIRRPRITVRRLPSVTVGTSSSGLPSVTVGAPDVKVENVPNPQITVGAPGLPEEGPHPMYDVQQLCRMNGDAAEVFIVNRESHSVVVRLRIENVQEVEIYVAEQSERQVGGFKNYTCEQVRNAIIVLDVHA